VLYIYLYTINRPEAACTTYTGTGTGTADTGTAAPLQQPLPRPLPRPPAPARAPSDLPRPPAPARAPSDFELLGDWVHSLSSSLSLGGGGGGRGGDKGGGTSGASSPPLPHDPAVLGDLLIDKNALSVSSASSVNHTAAAAAIAAAAAAAAPVPVVIPPAEHVRRMQVASRRLDGVGTVLTPERSELIRDKLPIYMQDETLTLLYSILTHGSDMTSFFSQTKGFQYTIIIIQTCTGEIFGGFAAGAWHKSSKYYGEGESFVFNFGKFKFKIVCELNMFEYVLLCLCDELLFFITLPNLLINICNFISCLCLCLYFIHILFLHHLCSR
jgi:hypothetical protein